MEQYDTKTKAPNIAMKILFIIDCSKLISMIMSGERERSKVDDVNIGEPKGRFTLGHTTH